MFKIGDKVRCIDNTVGIINGNVYIVEDLDEDGWIYVYNVNSELDLFRPERFELVKKETKKMKFIPMTDLEVISVNEVDGILIPE